MCMIGMPVRIDHIAHWKRCDHFYFRNELVCSLRDHMRIDNHHGVVHHDKTGVRLTRMARGSEDCEHTVCKLVEQELLCIAHSGECKTKSECCAGLNKSAISATTNKREEMLRAFSMADKQNVPRNKHPEISKLSP